jgi:hypothetical protein
MKWYTGFFCTRFTRQVFRDTSEIKSTVGSLTMDQRCIAIISGKNCFQRLQRCKMQSPLPSKGRFGLSHASDCESLRQMGSTEPLRSFGLFWKTLFKFQPFD